MTADFWDVRTALIPLCVTEFRAVWSCHCQVGWALAGKVYYRLWLRQEVSLGSLEGTRLLNLSLPFLHWMLDKKIKVKLRGRKYTLLNILEWNPKVTSSGNTAAELKSPDCCACVHNEYDRCIFSFKLAFYLRIFFPVKQTKVFWLRSILLRHKEVLRPHCAEWSWPCTLERKVLWVGQNGSEEFFILRMQPGHPQCISSLVTDLVCYKWFQSWGLIAAEETEPKISKPVLNIFTAFEWNICWVLCCLTCVKTLASWTTCFDARHWGLSACCWSSQSENAWFSC